MNLKLLSCLMIIVVVAYSCQTEQTILPQKYSLSGGRIVFENEAAGLAVLNDLANKQPEYLVRWEKNLDFTSLRSEVNAGTVSNDTMLAYYPSELSTILNRDREYQVGDVIIWFNDNAVFSIPGSNEELLKRIKNDPNNESFVSYRKELLHLISSVPKNGRQLPTSAVYSPIFKLSPTSHNFRFGNMLYNINSGFPNYYILQLRSCLQYQSTSNGNWYIAGETVKEITISDIVLTFDSGYTCSQNGIPSMSLTNTNQELKFTVCNYGSPNYFKGTCQARFFQRVESPYFLPGFLDCDQTVYWN